MVKLIESTIEKITEILTEFGAIQKELDPHYVLKYAFQAMKNTLEEAKGLLEEEKSNSNNLNFACAKFNISGGYDHVFKI